jgi:hypothetical protein
MVEPKAGSSLGALLALLLVGLDEGVLLLLLAVGFAGGFRDAVAGSLLDVSGLVRLAEPLAVGFLPLPDEDSAEPVDVVEPERLRKEGGTLHGKG